MGDFHSICICILLLYLFLHNFIINVKEPNSKALIQIFKIYIYRKDVDVMAIEVEMTIEVTYTEPLEEALM